MPDCLGRPKSSRIKSRSPLYFVSRTVCIVETSWFSLKCTGGCRDFVKWRKLIPSSSIRKRPYFYTGVVGATIYILRACMYVYFMYLAIDTSTWTFLWHIMRLIHEVYLHVRLWSIDVNVFMTYHGVFFAGTGVFGSGPTVSLDVPGRLTTCRVTLPLLVIIRHLPHDVC